jgi:hypothetical protein
MDEQNQNVADQNNAGVSDPASQNAPDPGTQGGDTGNQGTPDNQNKPQTDPRDEKIETLTRNVKALNKALIDERRKGRQGSPQPIGDDQGNPFDSEAGRYGVALELSDSRLRGGLEERIALYPELPAEEVQRIRLNPWAFASRKSFLSGDYETVLDEIEEQIADRVEKIAENSSEQPKGQPQADGQPPVSVNANPAPEGQPDEAVPGSAEDQNLWTMPLDKLEALKNKAVSKMSQKQQ